MIIEIESAGRFPIQRRRIHVRETNKYGWLVTRPAAARVRRVRIPSRVSIAPSQPEMEGNVCVRPPPAMMGVRHR